MFYLIFAFVYFYIFKKTLLLDCKSIHKQFENYIEKSHDVIKKNSLSKYYMCKYQD